VKRGKGEGERTLVCSSVRVEKKREAPKKGEGRGGKHATSGGGCISHTVHQKNPGPYKDGRGEEGGKKEGPQEGGEKSHSGIQE